MAKISKGNYSARSTLLYKQNMGLFYGFDTSCFKRKYRWMFEIGDISGDPGLRSRVLPPSKASRPNITFKEIEAQHVSETVYYPGKPDWKPISITLYDIKNNYNPVFQFIKNYYNPKDGNLSYSNNLKIPIAFLSLFSGCGDTIESWTFENVWPQQIEFGELDMSESAIVTIDLTLRYDRAWIEENPGNFDSSPNNDTSNTNNFSAPSLPADFLSGLNPSNPF